MDEKIILFTSWTGRWKYGKDLVFAAVAAPTSRSDQRFIVSKGFVKDIGGLFEISERSDAVFLDT